jgi:hypothetical protein
VLILALRDSRSCASADRALCKNFLRTGLHFASVLELVLTEVMEWFGTSGCVLSSRIEGFLVGAGFVEIEKARNILLCRFVVRLRLDGFFIELSCSFEVSLHFKEHPARYRAAADPGLSSRALER